MIGIYKITNNLDGKVYIGQASNLERRISEHKQKRTPTIDDYINVLGVENFAFEVLEECSLEELDIKEQKYIQQFNSQQNGYNIQKGGFNNSRGEGNGRAKLTEDDIIVIRTAYNNHEKQKIIYEQFKDKTTWSNFQSVWQGRTWTYIMPEVYTEENKAWYKTQNSLGENGSSAVFTNDEVLSFRKKYVSMTAKDLYKQEQLQDKITYKSFQKILWGDSYKKDIPIYKKSKKQWYLNGEPVSTIPGSGE